MSVWGKNMLYKNVHRIEGRIETLDLASENPYPLKINSNATECWSTIFTYLRIAIYSEGFVFFTKVFMVNVPIKHKFNK
jgi:hypothetical protein